MQLILILYAEDFAELFVFVCLSNHSQFRTELAFLLTNFIGNSFFLHVVKCFSICTFFIAFTITLYPNDETVS